MATSLPNIDAPPVAPGDVLVGKYRVERILGQGGMGVVVAARHIELGELFAIKFLLPTAAYYPDAIERFLREARASARLKGEHVAKVHDVGRLPDGRPYMVLEYLAGQDLDDIVRERGPLPVAEAITYVLQACEAIAEAHENGIVHRDIKPANLFVTRRPNGTAAVKVLDFGISRHLETESPERPGLTRPGVILGTPYYMSPEQMRQSKDADPRSDIWALGCVLYELLTGAAPFHSEVFTELVAMVLQEEPRPPSAHRKDIPPAVEAAVMRCLEKRREQRFQSVQELAAALRNAMPAASRPATISIAPPASIVAAMGRSLAASTTPGWGTQSGAAIHEPPKSRPGLVAGAIVGLAALLGGGAWLALPPRSPVAANAPAAATQAAVTPSITAPSTFVETAPSVATAEPAPSSAPTAAASAAAPPPAPQPKPSNPGHVAPVTSARPAAPKPTAEPAVPPSEKKKRNTMY